jgi:hypothetical protein
MPAAAVTGQSKREKQGKGKKATTDCWMLKGCSLRFTLIMRVDCFIFQVLCTIIVYLLSPLVSLEY